MSRKHWRQPPLRRQTLALAFVLILHALFALALWHEMQPTSLQLAAVPADSDQAMIVRFVDYPSTPPAAQPPAPPTPPPQASVRSQQAVNPRVRPVTHEKPTRDAMVVQNHEATPAPAASAASSLFAKDGSVRLATTPTSYATSNAKPAPAKPADDRQIMQHDYNQMHTKTTRFEKYFPPPNETAGGAVGRHVGDVIKKIADSMCDPHDPSTATNLLCGVPPIPPSPKEGDERLSLPSAALAHDPNPPKPPPLSTCIAEYNDTKPLSDGCPLNTPDLAFKAEMRVCIDLYRAGRHLKTWCPADTPQRAAAESSKPAGSSSVGSH